MASSGLSRRLRRTFLPWCARLIILGLIFQIGAFEHWHADPAEVHGVLGSAAHTAHCHGAASGCADGGGSFTGSLAEVDLLPRLAAPHFEVALSTLPTSEAAPLTIPSPPPQTDL